MKVFTFASGRRVVLKYSNLLFRSLYDMCVRVFLSLFNAAAAVVVLLLPPPLLLMLRNENFLYENEFFLSCWSFDDLLIVSKVLFGFLFARFCLYNALFTFRFLRFEFYVCMLKI